MKCLSCPFPCPDVNPKDYRAWYGLGQVYELLDMRYYAIQYYNRATALRYVSFSFCLLQAIYILIM